MTCDRLVLVLGDQLNRDSAALDDLDMQADAVWMAEAAEESEHVWSHKARITLFLAAMRHFRDQLRADGLRVSYQALDAHDHPDLASALAADLEALKPRCVIMVRAGDYRVQSAIERRVAAAGIELQVVPDRHFLDSPSGFDDWAGGRKQLRLEHYYRSLRQRHGILMDGKEPLGGKWNFDAENRKSFGKKGPGGLPAPRRFEPDETTREVIDLVERRFGDHPGSVADFDWPVTAAQGRQALRDFVDHRLARFGDYQDAMWIDEPWLYHSRLSSSLNLKLLDPRTAIEAAEQAYHDGSAPLAAVEGFVRQILGWREFVRGLYWRYMPDYEQDNGLGAEQPLPDFYWSGKTDMACLADALGQTLRFGYAHHIQRLMVTGLFALLLGVRPREVHEWYLAVYVDAVEWVELPNVIGMSQYADGGRIASKPYVASGRYIDRMSNYCSGCRYEPGVATGPQACPFTTLYWDFLLRHQDRFASHPRTALQWRNLGRLGEEERGRIRSQARALRAGFAAVQRGDERAAR